MSALEDKTGKTGQPGMKREKERSGDVLKLYQSKRSKCARAPIVITWICKRAQTLTFRGSARFGVQEDPACYMIIDENMKWGRKLGVGWSCPEHWCESFFTTQPTTGIVCRLQAPYFHRRLVVQ